MSGLRVEPIWDGKGLRKDAALQELVALGYSESDLEDEDIIYAVMKPGEEDKPLYVFFRNEGIEIVADLTLNDVVRQLCGTL